MLLLDNCGKFRARACAHGILRVLEVPQIFYPGQLGVTDSYVPPLFWSKPLYLCPSRSQNPSVHARVLLMTLDFQRRHENESRIFTSLWLIPF